MQPKKVRILDCKDKQLYKLPDTPLKCKLQDKVSDYKIVYVNNPWYNESNSNTETEYIAFCSGEYEVLEWAEDPKPLILQKWNRKFQHET